MRDWKVKCIHKRPPRVRVALCDMRGSVTGTWQDATAQIISGDEEQLTNRLGKVPEIAGEEDGLSGRRCLEEGEIVQVRQRHG